MLVFPQEHPPPPSLAHHSVWVSWGLPGAQLPFGGFMALP